MKCVAEVDIPYERIHAFVTDSAAYCKKAYREVLSPLFPLKDTISPTDVRLPPVPVSTRWNSWFLYQLGGTPGSCIN